jgi:hypothetical protein
MEEHSLRVFDSGVLRKIFGPKREEVRGWKLLNSVEIYVCFSSPDINLLKPSGNFAYHQV